MKILLHCFTLPRVVKCVPPSFLSAQQVRLQAELRSGGPRRYKGSIDAYRSIVRCVWLGMLL